MTDSAVQGRSEPELVTLARDRDRAAFEVLFRSYKDPLYSLALHYVGAPEIAEDLVQDIFVNIWKMGGGWRPHGPLHAYLYGAARNRSLQYLRHRRLQRRRFVGGTVKGHAQCESTEGKLLCRELERALQDALDALPERRRLIYHLSRQHGLSYAEIAAALAISIKTVETQMGRALKFLRRRLKTFL